MNHVPHNPQSSIASVKPAVLRYNRTVYNRANGLRSRALDMELLLCYIYWIPQNNIAYVGHCMYKGKQQNIHSWKAGCRTSPMFGSDLYK